MKKLASACAILVALSSAGCAGGGGVASPASGSASPATATPSPTPTPTPNAFSITGTVTLEDEEITIYDEESDFCVLPDGYDDMPGAQVTVSDASGEVLALGELDNGTPGGEVKDDNGKVTDAATTCVFYFTVDRVPGGERIYGLEVARRGVVRYEREDLDDPLTLTIG